MHLLSVKNKCGYLVVRSRLLCHFQPLTSSLSTLNDTGCKVHASTSMYSGFDWLYWVQTILDIQNGDIYLLWINLSSYVTLGTIGP